MDGNIAETLKSLAYKKIEISPLRRKRDDAHYSEIMVDVSKSEHQYESFDRESGTRAIMDQLLEKRDFAKTEQICIAYSTRMGDRIVILKELGLLKE